MAGGYGVADASADSDASADGLDMSDMAGIEASTASEAAGRLASVPWFWQPAMATERIARAVTAQT